MTQQERDELTVILAQIHEDYMSDQNGDYGAGIYHAWSGVNDWLMRGEGREGMNAEIGELRDMAKNANCCCNSDCAFVGVPVDQLTEWLDRHHSSTGSGV